MADCCNVTQEKYQVQHDCPRCGNEGKSMEIITLKSLLLPNALEKLNPVNNYRMCMNKSCNIVYFNEKKEVYLTEDINVPVYQKTEDEDCPVCYCFGWTRQKLKKGAYEGEGHNIISTITEHMKAGKCGCNVNNPQGSCCLGNVKNTLDTL